MSKFYHYEGEKIIGVEIQMALAGFKEDYLKVYFEGSNLIIAGDNLEDTSVISDKFRCKFEKALALTKYYDLKKTKITFENGLLAIFIPVAETTNDKVYLLGKG